MVALGDAVSLVNTAGLTGVALQLMRVESQLEGLKAHDPGGAGKATFVDGSAAAGGNGSEVRPFRTLEEAVAKINLDGAAFAAKTGTSAELAAAGTPARVYLAPGTYTQVTPFRSPAIVIPAPGAVVAALTWAPPAHASASTEVPFACGVLAEEFYGADPIVVGALSVVTVAPTTGSWAVSLTVSGPVARTLATADIDTSGPEDVAVTIDLANTLDVSQAAPGNLTGRYSTVGNITVSNGRAQFDAVISSGAVSVAGPATPALIASNCELTGGVTSDGFRIDSSLVGGALTSAPNGGQLRDCDVLGVPSYTGDLDFVDTTTWSQFQANGVTPTGGTTLFGTTAGSDAATGSPQVIPFGVTFTTPPTVTVTAQAAAVDATTFCGVTAIAGNQVTVAYGGVGAAAPTVLHWVASL